MTVAAGNQLGVYASTTANTGILRLDAGSQGTLNLNNASTQASQSSSHTGSDLVRQEMQGQGSQIESGHANVLNAGQLQVNAAKINVPLTQSLQQLTQQPGMGYLSQLLNDPKLQGKVNWSAVELAHQQWDYAHQGLSPTGAVIVAIVVAYCTVGVGSAVAGTTTAGATAGATTTAIGGTALASTTAAGVVSYTATGAAINAGFAALSSQAAVAFINNGGDIGKTLEQLGNEQSVKNILIAMTTAGVGQAVAGQGASAVAAQTATGCVTGLASGAGCEQGAKTAAILGAAGEAYRAVVGYAANAGPGDNRFGTNLNGTSTNDGSYQPIDSGTFPVKGQQQPADYFMNVIGLNKPGSFLSQGGAVSRALNQVPFVNATAGLHDYIFNADLGLDFSVWNVPTMLPAAAASIPAALNNPTISWITQMNTNTPLWKPQATQSGTPSVVRIQNPVSTESKGIQGNTP